MGKGIRIKYRNTERTEPGATSATCVEDSHDTTLLLKDISVSGITSFYKKYRKADVNVI